MQIISPSEAIPVAHPVILIVGEWGIGKSSLGYAHNTLLYDFDEGAPRAANRGYTARPTQWSDVDVSPAVLRDRSAVTVDTVAGALEMASTHLVRRNPKLGSNGALNQLGWGALAREFASFLAKVRDSKRDVLLLAHAKPQLEGTTWRTVARIPGKSHHEVMRQAHVVGHLHLRGGRRFIDFEISERFQGKNPGQWPALAVPPAAEAQTFMQEMFDQARVVLGRAAVDSDRVKSRRDGWRTYLAALRTPADFRDGLQQLRELKTADAAFYTQAHHLFSEAARVAGMKFDGAGGFRCVAPDAPVPRPLGATRPATVQPKLYSALTDPEFRQGPLARRVA